MVENKKPPCSGGLLPSFSIIVNGISFPLRDGFSTFKKGLEGCRVGHWANSLTTALDSKDYSIVNFVI
jgi:hypothetical protein